MRPYRRAVILAFVAVIGCACTSSATAPASTQSPTMPEPTARVDASPAIALVFDTDADAGHTAQILGALSRERIRASFIVTGLWAEQHRDLLLAITADGHQIINGGYHGRSFTGVSTNAPPLTAQERALELSRTEVTVYHLTGRSTRPYWRPPHGDIDASARSDAAAAGYTLTVTPQADTASLPGASAGTTVERLTSAAQNEAVYLLHTNSARDAEALPGTIKGLRAKGFELAAVEDVLLR